MTRQTMLIVVAIQSLLLVTLLLAWLRLDEKAVAVRHARANQQYGRQLADEIEQLRQIASVANESNGQASVKNSDVEDVANKAGISSNQIRSIRRLTPQRIPDTDYERRDIAVELREVTFEQAIRFLLETEQASAAFKATSLNLTANSSPSRRNASSRLGEGGRETWNVQLTLTQLVFVATSQNTQRREIS